MAEEGEVGCIEIEGTPSRRCRSIPFRNTKKKINIAGDLFILSPFDILNVFRRRLRDFYDFRLPRWNVFRLHPNASTDTFHCRYCSVIRL